MQKPFLRCGPYIPRLVINPGSSGLSAPRRNAHAAASWGQAGQGPQPRSRLNGDQGEHGWGGDRGEPCSQPGREQARDAAPTQQPPPRGDTLRSGPTGGAPSRGMRLRRHQRARQGGSATNIQAHQSGCCLHSGGSRPDPRTTGCLSRPLTLSAGLGAGGRAGPPFPSPPPLGKPLQRLTMRRHPRGRLGNDK